MSQTYSKVEAVKMVIKDRKAAYMQAFASGHSLSPVLLSDLRRFCRADTSCFNPDPRIHAVLEGRREVMLRILDFTTLSIDELCVKYGKVDPNAE